VLTSGRGDKGWTTGLVRRICLLRWLGYAMGSLPLLLLLRSQHAPAWLLASALAICFVWPYLAQRRVRNLVHPLARERENLICDSVIAGWLVAAVHFSPVATVVILLMFALDTMAVGGWLLFLAGVAANAAGLLIGVAMLGTTTYPFDSLIALAWLPVIFVYPLVLAKTTHDVSVKLLERSRRLRELSERDSLTGLVNRVTVGAKLQSLLADSSRAGEQLVVLFIDLDGFKTVNDALGHTIGDRLLIEVAARLSQCAHADDIVARYGGDEFVIVAADRDERVRRQLPDAVLAAMTVPAYVGGHELVIGASIGISVFPAHGSDAETLIRCADIAMYAAKNRGRNCCEYYRPEMRTSADAKLKLSARLRKAIERDALRLYYQPQVDMRNGEVLGVEALVRWRDEIYGEIAPADFIPVAEASGLMSELGEWVLRKACLQSAKWRRMGIRPMRMSINLSPLQLQGANVVDMVQAILCELGVDATHVELEVTETALIRQPEAAVRRLHALRRAGITVAIDDFGIGYSSLAQLHSLPVDRIKIDREFVRRIGEGDSGAIATAVVTLARALGLAVIAEGVETLAQQEFLLALGCVEAQGYRYSQALDAENITRLLLEGGSLPRPPFATESGTMTV
jgi:diguanylate cyclase (GGDEF)-like protein